ncbi:RagB/SusD family nutrient uptake outer membrane protein [Chitinophaga sp. 30R24]|uniref:RagB/SusD family nutrient uptake outer membrane protein n=1 Tax=Chitinophaga sp. 30R24 TaxID=3248838 RepID=UPI003B91E392
MKKIFLHYNNSNGKYISLFLLFLVLCSCSKDYLNTNPTDKVATSDAFSTTTNAWAAVNGIHRYMYSQFYSNQDQGGQSANMIYMDMMGEDLVMTAAANGWFNDSYKWLSHRVATDRVPKFNYLFYYTVIANANMIIANIDKAAGPEADRRAIKGEALAYRGWAYFQMIQLFGVRYDGTGANNGAGLPIVLAPSALATARATIADVYGRINQDLDAAMDLLQNFKRPNASHLNINVAQGIKARVALTQEKWDSAAYYAKLARTGFSLMGNAQYTAGFNDYTNPEWIWGIHQQADQTSYFYSFFAYMSANYASTNIKTNPKAIFSKLYALISATDVRKQLWDSTGKDPNVPIPSGGTRKPYMNRKFLVADPGSSIGDMPMMRSAEMYLIEAEGNARSGKASEAAQALYTLVHQRDPQYTLSTSTGSALVNEIMIQRRIELWGEGFRFYDLKRTNSPLDRSGGNHDNALAGGVINVPAGDIRWQFLIPQDEINNSNGVIAQNPLN